MTTLEQLQEDNKQCGCSACVHDRFVASTRKALLPSARRLYQARDALKVLFDLVDELDKLKSEQPCDCPKCAPEDWENWSKDWRKNGYTKEDYPCVFL